MWRRRRRSYEDFSDEYSALIDAEIEPFLVSLRADHADVFARASREILTEFLDAQRVRLLDLANQTETGNDTLRQDVEAGVPDQGDTLTDTLVFLSDIKPQDEWRAAQ